jgi:hypothetical protein
MGPRRVPVGQTLARIDQALQVTAAELLAAPASPAQLAQIYARHADELAAIVERLAAEERAQGGRSRTVTALGLLAGALGEQCGALDELAERLARVEGVR